MTEFQTLIVDDDPDVLAMHELFVQSTEGFAVAGTAARAAEALSYLEEHPQTDLILLDVHLPDGNGVAVLTEIRARFSQVGVIMITAAADAPTVRSAIGQGVDGYLVKPFSVEDFRQRLQLFRQSRLAQPERLAQSEIDALLQASPEAAPAQAPEAPPQSLPKGYAQATLDLIAESVRGTEHDISAAEVADACGVSRVSARRYLDLLQRRGQVELRPRYGSAGRPEHRYRWVHG
ncbi:response regulator [Glutamicibacter endophyticus]|uniref:response regulator n=1 Tax=Glutamicibacter endophyticus TaxID=1522174 RepID=UPI003AEF9946